MQALRTLREEDGAHAQSLVMGSCQKGGSRSRADGATDVEVGKDHPFLGHAVEVGGLWPGGTVEADVSVAHVIDEDDDEVWFFRFASQ